MMRSCEDENEEEGQRDGSRVLSVLGENHIDTTAKKRVMTTTTQRGQRRGQRRRGKKKGESPSTPCPCWVDRWSFAQNAKAVRKTRRREGGRDMTLLRDGQGWGMGDVGWGTGYGDRSLCASKRAPHGSITLSPLRRDGHQHPTRTKPSPVMDGEEGSSSAKGKGGHA